jgi:hypothetical protein
MSTSVKALGAVAGMEEEGLISLDGGELVAEALNLNGASHELACNLHENAKTS